MKTGWKQNTGNKNYILTENTGYSSSGLREKFKHRSNEEINHKTHRGYSKIYIREELQKRALLMEVLYQSKQFPSEAKHCYIRVYQATKHLFVSLSNVLNRGAQLQKLEETPKILGARGVT